MVLYFNEYLKFLLFTLSLWSLLTQTELIRKNFRLISNKTGFLMHKIIGPWPPCPLGPTRLLRYYFKFNRSEILFVENSAIFRPLSNYSFSLGIKMFALYAFLGKLQIAREKEIELCFWIWNSINHFRQRFYKHSGILM